jgi:hypothetical protein
MTKTYRPRVIDPKVVEKVRNRDRFCLIGLIRQDGCRGMLAVHHIQKRSQSGDDVEENLMVVCGRHHDLIEKNIIPTSECQAVMTRFHGFEYKE